ncbi:MAG: hypothetical protein U0359_17990 [Byssovorax sp.]
MLTNEIMGAVALAILWINTLLIAASATADARVLLARRRRLAPLPAGGVGRGLAQARVVSGEAGGPLAVHRTEQRGRTGAPRHGCPAILFADRSMVSEIHGGRLALDGIDGELTLAPTRDAEVWPLGGEIARAAACPSDEVFDRALPSASKARGFLRAVEAPILPGQEVFVYGAIEPSGEGRRLVAPSPEPLLLATADPRPFLARKARGLIALSLLTLGLAGAVTALTLKPPHFEGWSKLGGFLGVLFFLIIQPVAAAVREASRVPSKAVLRGAWVRSAPLPVKLSLDRRAGHGAAAP